MRCNANPNNTNPNNTNINNDNNDNVNDNDNDNNNVSFMKLSTTSLLELALARWLVDYWSQPPTFSSSELREMLVQAVSSMTRDGHFAGADDGGCPAAGVGGSSASRNGEGAPSLSPSPPPPPPAAEESLTAWLEGRASEVRKGKGGVG